MFTRDEIQSAGGVFRNAGRLADFDDLAIIWNAETGAVTKLGGGEPDPATVEKLKERITVSVNGNGAAFDLAHELRQQITQPAAPPPIANYADDGSAVSWRLRTLVDAYQERPPRQYVTDGILELGSLNILYGQPDGLKSMLLADMALDVASGRNWLPKPNEPGGGIATATAPVLWVDVDNGQRRTDDRFAALAQARGLPDGTPLYYVTMPNPPLNASDVTSMLTLRSYATHVGAGLVVIDNLSLVTGDVEENSAGMAGVMANFRALAETTGAAVVLIHHQRKSQNSNARMGETLRGHSSIEASLDLALLLTREPQSSQICITATKSRGVEVPPIWAEFSYTHKPGTNDLETARFWGVTVTDTTSWGAIDAAIMEVLETSGDGPNKGRLIAAVQSLGITAGRKQITRRVENMELQQQIVVTSGPKNAKLYALPKI